ncbi:MAG: class I SAM-dependent methyltransferase [Candidatus Sumerlaeia bacterium]
MFRFLTSLNAEAGFVILMMRRLLNRLSSAGRKIRHCVSTAWLRKLFPHAGPPDRFAHRLQRMHAAMIDIDGRRAGLVICNFIYPEVDGSIQTGAVKFFLPIALKEHPVRRVPLLHNAGYEIGDDEALDYVGEGLAVSTVHNHPLNVLSRGPKLEWALMHAVRRLPFVDDARVMVKGICTGGNQAILSAVETFPLLCAMPIVPLVNVTYNFSYLEENMTLATSCRSGSNRPWLPSVAAQAALLEQAAQRFGDDWEAPAYFELSPARLVEYVTAPVLTVFCTADLNVPMDQVAIEWTRPYDAADFPGCFTRDMSAVVAHPGRRVRLLDVVPSGDRDIFTVLVPERFKRRRLGESDFTGEPLEMPFSRSRQWSVAIVDEGPPEPRYCHFKHRIQPDFAPFRQWADGVGIQAEQLTGRKLEWLMKRWMGVQPLDFMVNPGQGSPHACNLLDFPQAERADVLRGLITYARNDAAALRLADVYAALPAHWKAMGESLGEGSADSVRRALARASTGDEARNFPGQENLQRPETVSSYFGRGYYRVYHDFLLPPENTRFEVDFLIRELKPRRGERWLDMPCGYGRHMAALAEAQRGLCLLGGDLCRDYLRHGDLRPAAVSACDMRRLPFADSSFDAVLNMLNSFGYYPPGIANPDDRAVLAEFARVLKPGGRLALDLINRPAMIERVRRDPIIRHAGGAYELLERFVWDQASELLHNETVWRWPGGRERACYMMRLYTPAQIERMLNRNGLEVENMFGGFDGRRFDPRDAGRMLVIARKHSRGPNGHVA